MDAGIVYGCLTPHPPILVPAVAGRRVEQVNETREAMGKVAAGILALDPDVVALVSPHGLINPHAMTVVSAGSFAGGFGDFGAPDVRLSAPGDPAMAAEIATACEALHVPLVRSGKSHDCHFLDHGAAVPLYFLLQAGVQCPLVLLSFCSLGTDVHLRFGRAVAQAARAAGKRVALIASGDLSHRLFPGAPAGYSPLGKQFDDTIVGALRLGDRAAILNIDDDLREQAGECGYRSLLVALGAMPESAAEVLSYEGPFGVGYLVARFVTEVAPSATTDVGHEAQGESGRCPDEIAALRLAREAVESYVVLGEQVAPPPEPEGLLGERAGVFVSIKREGELRGCIGTLQPFEANVASEIIRNAIASASRDPRFPPVCRAELPSLTYSIDILSLSEPVDDACQLDPKRYGVIVEAGGRKGLLLPDLEGVESAEAQLEIARRKAGIPPGTTVKIRRFTVRRIKEAGSHV